MKYVDMEGLSSYVHRKGIQLNALFSPGNLRANLRANLKVFQRIKMHFGQIKGMNKAYMAAGWSLHLGFRDQSHMIPNTMEKWPFCFAYIVGTAIAHH